MEFKWNVLVLQYLQQLQTVTRHIKGKPPNMRYNLPCVVGAGVVVGISTKKKHKKNITKKVERKKWSH